MLLAILIHIVDYNTSILEEKISVCYTTKKKDHSHNIKVATQNLIHKTSQKKQF